MRRTISIVLIGTLSLPALAHDKSYEHEHVRIPQTSTENTGEPPKVFADTFKKKTKAKKRLQRFTASLAGALVGIALYVNNR